MYRYYMIHVELSEVGKIILSREKECVRRKYGEEWSFRDKELRKNIFHANIVSRSISAFNRRSKNDRAEESLLTHICVCKY